MFDPKQTVSVLGIPGSLRRNSFNRALLRVAGELLPPHMTLEIFDLHEIPFYNADLEAKGTPPPVMAFRRAMQAADALLIATPEYNYSIPGVLKNALDWASRRQPDGGAPLDGKVVAIMGAGGGFGTVRAQNHLRDILLHNDTFTMARPQVMVSRAYAHFDENGQLTDARTRQKVADLLQALDDWTRRLRPSPAGRLEAA